MENGTMADIDDERSEHPATEEGGAAGAAEGATPDEPALQTDAPAAAPWSVPEGPSARSNWNRAAGQASPGCAPPSTPTPPSTYGATGLSGTPVAARRVRAAPGAARSRAAFQRARGTTRVIQKTGWYSDPYFL